MYEVHLATPSITFGAQPGTAHRRNVGLTSHGLTTHVGGQGGWVQRELASCHRRRPRWPDSGYRI